MSRIHDENTFETAIVEHLYENGWTLGAAENFDKDLALDKRAVLNFVQKTQNAEWTRFLPFNKGDNNGAGNPLNENGSYKTAYFWEEILQPDGFLEIIGRFVHLQRDSYRIDGKLYSKETMILSAKQSANKADNQTSAFTLLQQHRRREHSKFSA